MIASQNSDQTFVYSRNGRRAGRLLLGVSTFSGLTIGLGLTGMHLLHGTGSADFSPKLPVAAMVPVSGEKILSSRDPSVRLSVDALDVKAGMEAKTARVGIHDEEAAARTRPLSPDAFNQRFVAPFTASALPQPQRFASRLLASPQNGDLAGSFTPRLADAASAMKEASTFRVAQAAVPAPAAAPEVPTTVALALPGELPRELQVAPAPAPERQTEAAVKPDPRSAGKPREKADQVEAETAAKPILRPGKTAKTVVAAAFPDKPQVPAKRKGFFEALGFAKPDNPDESRPGRSASIPWPGGNRKVAYYDISAQRVYMPNGETMEAHSGQGKLRDNPAFVHIKMRGPTPPSTYRLSMRETLFHGVQALRLTPVDGVNPHGRVGLLTHSYLRRVPGDSAGCIVFKDYPRFLAAYKRGQVEQVVVVSSMGKSKAPVAEVASAATSFVNNR